MVRSDDEAFLESTPEFREIAIGLLRDARTMHRILWLPSPLTQRALMRLVYNGLIHLNYDFKLLTRTSPDEEWTAIQFCFEVSGSDYAEKVVETIRPWLLRPEQQHRHEVSTFGNLHRLTAYGELMQMRLKRSKDPFEDYDPELVTSILDRAYPGVVCLLSGPTVQRNLPALPSQQAPISATSIIEIPLAAPATPQLEKLDSKPLTVDERLTLLLSKRPDEVKDWSADRIAEELECSATAVKNAKCWKGLMKLRESAKIDRLLRQQQHDERAGDSTRCPKKHPPAAWNSDN